MQAREKTNTGHLADLKISGLVFPTLLLNFVFTTKEEILIIR
jgi:hypothetical protein